MRTFLMTALVLATLAGCGRSIMAPQPMTAPCPPDKAICHKDSDCLDIPIMCTVGTVGSPFAEVLPTGRCVNGSCETQSNNCVSTCEAGSGCLPASAPLACSDPYVPCDGRCVNTQWHDANCGGCGVTCADGKYCQYGKCICTWYTSLCNGKCINTMSDPENCGGCGIRCAIGLMCEVGKCSKTCNPAYLPGELTVCNGQCVNTVWDPDNCGLCGRRCNGQHIVTRKCTFECRGDCENGWLDCNHNQFQDGCEIDALNDPNNCGACGVKCPHACVKGHCQ